MQVHINQALQNAVPFLHLPVRLRRVGVAEDLLDALVPQVRLYKVALELAAIVRPQVTNALLTVARNLAHHLLKCRVNARRVFIRHRHSPALLGEEVDGGEDPFESLVRLVGE